MLLGGGIYKGSAQGTAMAAQHLKIDYNSEPYWNFFPKEVLSRSNALGGRLHPALDNDTVGICLRKFCFHVLMLKYLLGYVQSKHSTVSCTILIDDINDKCANVLTCIKLGVKNKAYIVCKFLIKNASLKAF